MMHRRLPRRLLSILLSLLLLACAVPAAQAEIPLTYAPGQVTRQLLRSAFSSGMMLCADVSAECSLNPALLEMSEDDAAAAQAVCEVLKDAQLTVGAAQIPDGIALMLRGKYLAAPAAADVTLSLTTDGAAIETSLLPGERIAFSWEAALTEAGFDENTRAILLNLRDTDPAQIAALIEQTLRMVSSYCALIASPYQQIVADFFAAQPMEIRENVAAEGDFPAAAKEVSVIITQKAFGGLLVSLAERLEQDPILTPMFDSFLLGATDDPTLNTAAFCAALCSVGASMTDEEYPFVAFFGYDAAEQPLYTSFCLNISENDVCVLNVIDTHASFRQPGYSHLLQAFFISGESYSGLTATYFYADDLLDPNVHTLHAAAEFELNNELVFTAEFSSLAEPVPGEDCMPAYAGQTETAIGVLLNGQAVTSHSASESSYGLTSGGSEYAQSSSAVESYVGDTLAGQVNSEISYSVSSSLDGGMSGSFSGKYAAPQLGVESLSAECSLYALPYSPKADAAVLSLDSADDEAISAMLTRLQDNAEALIEALSILPDSAAQTAL